MESITVYLINDQEPLHGSYYEPSTDHNMVKLSGFKSHDGKTLHTFYIPKDNVQYIEVTETK